MLLGNDLVYVLDFESGIVAAKVGHALVSSVALLQEEVPALLWLDSISFA